MPGSSNLSIIADVNNGVRDVRQCVFGKFSGVVADKTKKAENRTYARADRKIYHISTVGVVRWKL